ncbi:hypothetical protein NPL4_00770, partial [Metamycoplasma hyosynoviae]
MDTDFKKIHFLNKEFIEHYSIIYRNILLQQNIIISSQFFIFVLNIIFNNFIWVKIITSLLLLISLIQIIIIIKLLTLFRTLFKSENIIKKIYILYRINKVLKIKSINIFFKKYLYKVNKTLLKQIRKINKKFVLHGSSAIMCNINLFWRAANDIDLIILDYDYNNKKIEKSFENQRFLKLISEFSYINYKIQDISIEILTTKFIPYTHINKHNLIWTCNIYWQIAMKIFQLIEYVLARTDNKKTIEIIIDLMWIYNMHTKNFKRIKKINNALNYLLLSNFFVYYYLPYKVRITNNLEQINEKIKQIFIKNNWLNNLDKKFYDFLINLNFLNRIFDANLLKKINNIEKVLMFKRDLIWKEILNIDSQN